MTISPARFQGAPDDAVQPAAAVPDRERAIRAIKILLFSASVVPSVVGGTIAHAAGSSPGPVPAGAAGLFIGQPAATIFTTTSRTSTPMRVTRTPRSSPAGVRCSPDLVRAREDGVAGAACLLIDLAIAAYFVELRGSAILWFALAGGLIAVFFTPLMLRGSRSGHLPDLRPALHHRCRLRADRRRQRGGSRGVAAGRLLRDGRGLPQERPL